VSTEASGLTRRQLLRGGVAAGLAVGAVDVLADAPADATQPTTAPRLRDDKQDRATAFYRKLGWRQEVTPPGSGVVQFSPPASGCSIQFGTNRTSAAPASAQGLYLIVSDIVTARERLIAGPASGPAPGRHRYGSLASFSDPDGNRWLLQEVTTWYAAYMVAEQAGTELPT
jgi:hypothetical protein